MNLQLLAQLSNAFGPSGFEDDVQDIICRKLQSLNVPFQKNRLGNIIVKLTSKENKPTILLDAHMDEVGFIIKYIYKNGFLKLETVGGITPNALANKLVKLKSDDGKFIPGITTSIPPHLGKEQTVTDFYIDIGARNAEEIAQQNIRIGTPGIVDFTFTQLNPVRCLGKAMDDRIGCYMLLALIEELADHAPKNINLAFSFSVQEEVGLRGIESTINEVNPDYFLAIEGTVCADLPGVPEDNHITHIDQGPVITVMDKRSITPPKMVSWAIESARKNKIPYQFKTPAVGGTNTGVAQQMKHGIPSIAIATPCRYIHSQAAMFNPEDFIHAKKLLLAMLNDFRLNH